MRRTTNPTRRALIGAIAALGACVAGGCYQRTIHSEGPGSTTKDVQQPYQGSYLIDDLLFGETIDGKPVGGDKRRNR